MRKFFIIFFIFLSFLYAKDLTLNLDNQTAVYDNFEIEYIFDKTELLTINDLEKKEFENVSKNSFSLGYSKQNVWLKINLFNQSDDEDFILTLNETFYEKANLYYKKDGKLIEINNGLFLPLEKREVKYNKLSFKLNLEKNNKYEIFILLNGKYSYFGKVSILKEAYFKINSFLDMNNIYLLIFGTTSIILIFSLGLWISLKEKIYYYYSGYTFFNIIYLIKMSGLLSFVNLEEYIYVLQSSAAFLEGFLILFSLEYLNTKKYLSKYHKYLRLFSIPYFLIGFILIFDYQPWNQILNIMSLLIIVVFLPLSIYLYFKGHKKSVYYTLALLLYFCLAMLFLLMIQGKLGYTNLTRYGLVFATTLENIIFSIMIISRYNDMKNKEIQSQEELINIKINQENILKNEVIKRTDELTLANNKLSNLLNERELLLKEILHRVKNNFHMIIGILHFESQKHKNTDIFSELMNRIKSMSKIHEYLLYTSKDLKKIKVKDYLNDIIQNISYSYTNSKINISSIIEDLHLELDEIISLSIIINEIINNSIKHHKNSEDIVISLSLKKQNNKYILEIKDNGAGFNLQEVEEGLGLKLVKDFASKLANCKYENYFNEGNIFMLSFEIRGNYEI
ncbi:7TM diverse intracellular signaling domain-containing protein [Aliarcobacter butzleri]|uniref:7TM diverse intracellular signaling domain-containing protein n=1 Tax=Aliarcobacter butzleri TaxID=28197 RepID=UPI0024DE783B|nr:7TM diverse intracellular signaling domain-containing protein [Aliarcobacter butzleri]MDK2091586.1 7TM diverse intracellular signaling domain-containing protein [Aliarcobacter butzleri]